MAEVNIHEAKTHLSRLVERAARGEEIVIAKAGTPRAKLVPIEERPAKRELGFWRGQIFLADDWDSDQIDEEIARFFRAGETEVPEDQGLRREHE